MNDWIELFWNREKMQLSSIGLLKFYTTVSKICLTSSLPTLGRQTCIKMKIFHIQSFKCRLIFCNRRKWQITTTIQVATVSDNPRASFLHREVRISHMSEDRTQRAIFLPSVSYPRKSAQHSTLPVLDLFKSSYAPSTLHSKSLALGVALDIASRPSRRATTESKQLTKSGVVACVHK